MSALQIETNYRELQPVDRTMLVRELAQQAALERLLAVLDPRQVSDPYGPMPAMRWDDQMHRLARLRAARAAYNLESSGTMLQLAPGGWIRNRDEE